LRLDQRRARRLLARHAAGKHGHDDERQKD